MTARLIFEQLRVRDFRNIPAVDLTPAPRVNVISGDNGQGKTSLLEALYLVATSRSFRAERFREMLRDGAELAQVRASINDDGLVRQQRVTLTRAARAVQLDGKKPQRLGAYATQTPVVVFHPGDLELVGGGASARRTVLDRIALFLDPSSADHRARYQRAARARLAALEQRGPRSSELFALEALVAQHGAALTRCRREAAAALEEALLPAFAEMLAAPLPLEVRFVPGATEEPESFVRELEERRGQDLRRRTTSFGPQRDDLELTLDGRSARRHASQGQQRILTLAIKWAELVCVRRARGAHPVLLLDDVSSELDPTRTGAVYEFLRQTESQLFVTTTRPELFATPGLSDAERADWRLSSGALVRP